MQFGLVANHWHGGYLLETKLIIRMISTMASHGSMDIRIKEVESRTIHLDPAARRHPLLVLTAKAMKGRDLYDKGRLNSPWNEPCLRLLVSKESLDRALAILNGIVILLEKEGFQVSNSEEMSSII
jgi:hypothetical protein